MHLIFAYDTMSFRIRVKNIRRDLVMQRNKKAQQESVADLRPRKRRERTHEALITEAMQMTRDGRFGSIAEVAHAAGVSRATAYRYFPNQARLIDAILDESLGPVRSFDSDKEDGVERIRTLFEHTFPLFKEFEPQLRAALQLSIEHWALQRTGTLREEPFRRGRRVKILQRAAAPLKQKLGTRTYQKLLRALSLIYGVEPYVVLKDMWGAKDSEVSTVTRWVMEAVLNAALAEAKG
jgi:AcrR family transcriptional regulator